MCSGKIGGAAGLMFGDDDELLDHLPKVLDVRSRIKLANHEAIIIRDKEGKDSYRFGSGGEGERSFFLPPYCEKVLKTGARPDRSLYVLVTKKSTC